MGLHMGRTQKDLLEELIEQTHRATSEGSNDIKFPTGRGQGSWLQGGGGPPPSPVSKSNLQDTSPGIKNSGPDIKYTD